MKFENLNNMLNDSTNASMKFMTKKNNVDDFKKGRHDIKTIGLKLCVGLTSKVVAQHLKSRLQGQNYYQLLYRVNSTSNEGKS
jgi:hypothetical protein